MPVGIVGSGNMGRAIGVALARLGHPVLFGARDPGQAEAAAALGGATARAGSNADAAAFGEIVVYTARDVPPQSVVGDVAVLAGKTVVDINNGPMPVDYRLGPDRGAPAIAERLQAALPGAIVVKAFNTMGMELFAYAPEALRAHRVSCFLAGDDAAAKERVGALATAIGFVPVDCGPLAAARMLEGLGDFIRHMMAPMKHGFWATVSVTDLPPVDTAPIGGRRSTTLRG